MQQIIKPAGPSRQLFETVNFALMKTFDFLVKIVIFWAFFLFLGDLRHVLRPQSNTWSGQNAWHESPPKKEKCPKNGYFDYRIKNFHKSKVDGLQKLPTRACLFEDFLHFKGWPYINHKISIDFADKFMIFFGLLDLFYDYPLDFGSIIHPQFFFLYMGYFDSVFS